jgi:hypothetical protein
VTAVAACWIWCEAAASLGGTNKMIDDILTAPALDAWPVDADDSLAADPDQINKPR